MEKISDALLSTQRALLDVVTPELRAVVVDLDNDKVEFYIRFYYDGEVSEEIFELWSAAVTEASAGLNPIYDLDSAIERLDYPKEIPCRGRFAYSRKE